MLEALLRIVQWVGVMEGERERDWLLSIVEDVIQPELLSEYSNAARWAVHGSCSSGSQDVVEGIVIVQDGLQFLHVYLSPQWVQTPAKNWARLFYQSTEW